ncbi:nucleotidyltransferase domain-containing protein [Terribacillus saccharophilus]|uniref:nucleotidyltransferase domain-containing protein n=1 Tax=Terribacillus saccharophilus TaxID=361277 RepID=UPI002DD1D0BD|nr:nucleotidyltransferase domain-containing protein [Terribacillus saccharophilus]
MRDPKDTAKRFIETNHPECEGAMLAGSCARGEATATSDLDIIILYTGEDRAYRESLLFEGWPVEVFVYTGEAYQNFFASDAERGIPSMPRMVSEAIVLKEAPVVTKMKSEASSIFAAGPSPWNKQKIDHNRYMITNLIDDFLDKEIGGEAYFLANTIVNDLAIFSLRTRQHWIGSGKWMFRELKGMDPTLANQFEQSLEAFYKQHDKRPIVQLADDCLEPFGGRLFEGYYLG